MESKRGIKKATGLDADELSRAYYSIKHWKSVLDREMGDEDEDTPAQLDKVDDFILLMERRMSAVRNANFSSTYEKDLYFKLLDSMNLRPLPGGLQLKDRATLREKVSQIHEAGSTHFMSAQNFYDKLRSLRNSHFTRFSNLRPSVD
ncbi:hypothetical protein QCA50_003684 [Cerrena zonata]|uniref:Uncharacterized protein n=1 Tax=Cerrena zonata TaxID=2478898 RepID=A0AAW0GKJ2_9APHY